MYLFTGYEASSRENVAVLGNIKLAIVRIASDLFDGDVDFLEINKLELPDCEFHVAIGLRQRCSELKKERNRMPPVNSFDEYLP